MRGTLKAFGFALLTLAASPLLAQRSDDEVRAEIEKRLSKEKIELQVSVEGKTVKLAGQVRNVFEKNQALEIALAQPEVETVEPDVEIAAAESDQKLGEAVVKEVRRYSRFTVFDDVSAYIENGNVALFGWVTEPYKKTEIEKRLHNVIGIENFKNDIEVLPLSSSDDRVRQAVYRNIYRDPTFSDFASMVIPPIHIIVSGSRVILTGVVNSQLMKQKAESLARGTPGVLSVESRLRIGS
jgi:osmotically-inducible protein OsmY